MIIDTTDLRPFLVKILKADKEETNGTGFFCHPNGYILTCYHVIEKYIDKRKAEVNLLYKDNPFTPEPPS